MVRHDEGRRAAPGGGARILGVKNAFKDELARPQALDPFDVLPTQRRVKLAGDPHRERIDVLFVAADIAGEIAERSASRARHARQPCRLAGDVENLAGGPFRRDRHAVLDVAMTLPEYLQIDGEHERATFGGSRPLDQRTRKAAILHDVDLKPKRLVDRGSDLLDRADR